MTREGIALYAGGALLLLCLILVLVIWNLKGDLEEERRGRAVALQNLQATRDSATQAFEQLQEAAVFIEDLKDSVEQGREVFLAASSRYQLALDSLRAAGLAQTPEVTDTTVRVPFSGKKDFVRFEGWTLYNLNTKAGTYRLNLDYDPPVIETDLFRDEGNGLWYVRAESRTPGLRIRSTTVLDSATYQRLQQYPAPERSRWFGLGVIGNGESAYAAASLILADKYEVLGGYALARPAGASSFLAGFLWRP